MKFSIVVCTESCLANLNLVQTGRK